MNNWKYYFGKMICINCNSTAPNYLLYESTPKIYKYVNVTGELVCQHCGMVYPLYQDIPVVFKDAEIIRTLLDSNECRILSQSARGKMKLASQVTGDQLQKFKSVNELKDALSWELLFWDRWQCSDSDKIEIEQILKNDEEGGGRLQFFNKISKYNNLKEKVLLNIGAGRDRLLEKFVGSGCSVIEQDIVLESLLLLKKRGAIFCLCCDARNIPFENNIADLSTSFEVLHHIHPIQQPINELIRLTKENIYFVEPNKYAITRAALLLPGFIKNRIKKSYSNDYSHSPYEYCISPFQFKKDVRTCKGKIVELSYPSSTWISKNSAGLKSILRKVNLAILKIAPMFSAHYFANIRSET